MKKWRNAFVVESNGQIKQSPPLQQEDVNLNQLKAKKRPAKDTIDNINVKRVKINGGISELDFSDNSNSSFKDVISTVKTEPKRDVILINSDSNSSMPEKHDPHLDQQMPKKRGRKKGSKNHKNLIDEAESSFTSKLAVSRGNSKVKTTQELIASLQNKNSSAVINSVNVKPKEDLMEKAAKLTERVSIIDQKLNTNANRNKNFQRNKYKLEKNEKVIESGSVINDKSLLSQNSSIKKEEELINVVDAEEEAKIEDKAEKQETESGNINIITSLSVEDALAQLPPIDKSVLLEEEEDICLCYLKEVKPDFSVEEDSEINLEHRFEVIEDHSCPAKVHLTDKYHLDYVTEKQVHRLHNSYIPNVNGNISIGPPKPEPALQENDLYVNVVPNVNLERIPKDMKDFSSENFRKYSVSETGGEDALVKSEVIERTGDEARPDSDNNSSFREWHEVIETPSHDGEILKILPYVIID